MTGILEIAGWAILAATAVQAAATAAVSVHRAIQKRRLDAAALEAFERRSRTQLEQAETERARSRLSWNGYRKFVVAEVVDETDSVRSFRLRPHDGRPVPTFRAGQHLTFRVSVPGQKRPVTRCYSISEGPGSPEGYRITVKRIERSSGEAGLVSGWFHDALQPGRILDVRAPAGQFTLDDGSDRPVVLVAGGVGVTPIFSMLDRIATASPNRETWLFYGCRNRFDHIFSNEIEAHSNTIARLRRTVCYSRPTEDCRPEVDYQLEGRVTIDLLREALPSPNFDFYVCGPEAMMEDLLLGLSEWGVPEDRIHFEAFGPASVQSAAVRIAPPAGSETPEEHEVVFDRSGKAFPWTPEAGSLLDLAEKNDVPLDFGCRAGSCGSCVVAIVEGDVDYRIEPGFEPDPGTCLACIAVPRSRVVLDA